MILQLLSGIDLTREYHAEGECLDGSPTQMLVLRYRPEVLPTRTRCPEGLTLTARSSEPHSTPTISSCCMS